MSRLPVLFDLYYFDLFYFAGGYRRLSRLSSAQCNLRSRRVHLCFDAFSERKVERTASSAVQKKVERDQETVCRSGTRGRTMRLRITAERHSGREKSTT
jgi:hypothetical protein